GIEAGLAMALEVLLASIQEREHGARAAAPDCQIGDRGAVVVEDGERDGEEIEEVLVPRAQLQGGPNVERTVDVVEDKHAVLGGLVLPERNVVFAVPREVSAHEEAWLALLGLPRLAV